MTVLNIYALDDTENLNVIACLPEGKHIIGRGDLLQVTDKRVSRKHAIIEVSGDKIHLTSVHVNPCFFKAANGKTLSVLSQNQHSELNEGDQFALLPESCWFKVKIKKEDQPLNGLGDSTVELNNKRHHDNLEENNIVTDSKRARLSTASTSNNNDETSLHATNNNTVETTNTVNSRTSHDRQENEEFGDSLQDNNDAESNTSLNLAETARITDEPDDMFMEIKEERIEHGDVSSIIFPGTSSSNAINNNPSASTSNMTIKEEPNNEDVIDVSNIIFPGTSSSNAINNNPSASTSNMTIKEEPNNEDVIEKNDIAPPENDTSNNEQPEVKTENPDDNQKEDEASGSGTGPKKVRRERCWYGDRCYRKNPNHRVTFSHPGDQDYESDPDDDRPDCPFGATCYRKNADHRKEYKHTGKPAPKPRPRSPSPASPTVQNLPGPNQKKPRRAATQKRKPQVDIDSSQDDYDIEDPFINDGSSDDFEPSDGIDSDSSDWEDSQEADEESQERNRMLKEAKKFTKKGKKK